MNKLLKEAKKYDVSSDVTTLVRVSMMLKEKKYEEALKQLGKPDSLLKAMLVS